MHIAPRLRLQMGASSKMYIYKTSFYFSLLGLLKSGCSRGWEWGLRVITGVKFVALSIGPVRFTQNRKSSTKCRKP